MKSIGQEGKINQARSMRAEINFWFWHVDVNSQTHKGQNSTECHSHCI